MTKEEQKVFEEVMKVQSMGVAFIVLVNTGLRAGELSGLTWKDVDFEKQLLHVKNAKNNKDREIPFSDSVAEYLQWYKRKTHPVYNDTDLFFRSNRRCEIFSVNSDLL